jgi:hypothetical protein
MRCSDETLFSCLGVTTKQSSKRSTLILESFYEICSEGKEQKHGRLVFCFFFGFLRGGLLDYFFRHGKSVDFCCKYSQVGLKYLSTFKE